MATIRARPSGTLATTANAWRHVFPTGWWLSVGSLAYRAPGGGTVDAFAGRNLYDHPEQGMRALKVDALADGITPYLFVQAGTGAAWDAEQGRGAPIWHYTDPANRIDAGNTQGIAVEWLNNGAVDPEDYPTALGIAQDTMDFLAGHVDQVIAWRISDDVQVSLGAQKVVTMARAVQDADPLGRPCPLVVVDPDVWALYPPGDLRLAITYRYPLSYRFGVEQPEGDFHNYVGLADLGGGGEDWVDALRQWTNELPAGVPCWLILQAFPSAEQEPQYRPPTVRELRKQFWIGVGEGFKGLWWFTANANPDGSVGWTGINDVALQPASDVIGELHGRLTPDIRRRLLRADRVANVFAAAGGGSTGYIVDYDDAYVSTLQDRVDGTVYAVLCNHATTDEDVTLSSATVTGALRNLETGEQKRLPLTERLPALDGTIWVHVRPDPGVPVTELDDSEDVEAWWARHYANPDSDYHIPREDVRLWPRELSVGPLDDVQAIVDTAAEGTTLYLAPGTYPRIEVTGKRGLAFVAADPGDKPVVPLVWAVPSAAFDTYPEWTAAVLGNTGDARSRFFDPAGNLLFRDVAFVMDPAVATARAACWAVELLGQSRLLFEGCTFDDYVGFDSGGGFTGAPVGHPGHFVGHGGLRHLTARHCTFTSELNSGGFGYPNAAYLDGAHGCVFFEDTLVGPKWHGGGYLFLANDDFTRPYRGQISLDPLLEDWSHRFVAVVRNTSGQMNARFVSTMGSKWLVAENTLNQTGNMTQFVEAQSRCSGFHEHPYTHRYRHYGGVVRDNDILGGSILQAFVRFFPDANWLCYLDARDVSTYANQSRVGLATVTGNRVTGNVPAWVADAAGQQVASDGPHVEFGNLANWVP